MNKLIVILSVILINGTFLYGQNLVANPSFENYIDCPTQHSGTTLPCPPVTYDAVSLATPWYMPTCGTSDYYNQCTINGLISVPNNSFGYQLAKTGNAYVGVLVYLSNNIWSEWREYIQSPLIDTLKTGKRYYGEIYVNLADSWDCPVDGFGLYLSKGIPDTTGVQWRALQYIPQISNPTGNFLTDTVNWMKISGTFIAEGGENYITIGNFKDNANTQTESCVSNRSYYFIDDILLMEDTTTGIYDLRFTNNDIRFYPNPFTNKITMEINSRLLINNYELIIYDQLGRIVKNLKIINEKNEISREGLSNGLYWYAVLDNDKKVVGSGKLVIQ